VLFLFSAALRIGRVAEFASKAKRVTQLLAKLKDNKFVGDGPNPYKYPDMSDFAGRELTDIIEDNANRLKGMELQHPVFAAHSIHDETARLDGITEFFAKNVRTGTAFIVSQQVAHADLVLDSDIALIPMGQFPDQRPPRANPQFAEMMAAAVTFFKRHVEEALPHS